MYSKVAVKEIRAKIKALTPEQRQGIIRDYALDTRYQSIYDGENKSGRIGTCEISYVTQVRKW